VPLNFHHLRYFWVVAREGSVARAATVLKVAAPTITGQVRRLEVVIGERVFERAGRGLVLTECGRMVFDYAERIFLVGEELRGALRDRNGTRAVPLRVGVADVLPKPIVCAVLRPALDGSVPVRLICREDRAAEEFIEELTAGKVDLVLADAPAEPGRSGISNYRLGECGTTVFGVEALAREHRGGFPGSLDRAPFVVAGRRSARRRALEKWCKEQGLTPGIACEVDDASLIMEFGSEGRGLFIGPTPLERVICSRYAVEVVGRPAELRLEFYAILADRQVQHPAVRLACEAICRQFVIGDGRGSGDE
jgi:LysR family transcriptional activator of nhaA